MEDDEDAASESSVATSAADYPREDIAQSSKQLRVIHHVEETEGNAPSTNRKIDACVIDCKGAIYRRNRQLYDTIANQETRNANLKAEEEGIRKRFEMMEIVMPALIARDILRQRDKPDFSLSQFLKKKLQVDQGYFPLPCEPSNHHNVRIRELEAEKKKEQQRLDEAMVMWEEIKKILEQRKRERNELVRINEELELKYDDLVDEFQEKKKKEKERECDGFNCLELGLGESESATSITSASLECIIKLQEVAETTLCMKRNIADLERRECEYMQTLQCAGQILSKKSQIGKKDLKWKGMSCSLDEDLSDPEYATCPEDSDYEGEPCPRGTKCFDESQIVNKPKKPKSQKPLTRTKNDSPIKTKELRSRLREGAAKVDKAADPVPLEGQGDSVGDNLRSDGRLGVPKEELESWLTIAEKMHSVVSKCLEGNSMERVVETMGKEMSTHLKKRWKDKKRSSEASYGRSKDQESSERTRRNSLEARTSAGLPLIEKVSDKSQQRESKMKSAASSTLEVKSQSPMTENSLRSFDARPGSRELQKRKHSNRDEIEKGRRKSISVSTDDLVIFGSPSKSRELPSREDKSRKKSYEREKQEEKIEDLNVGGMQTKSREFQEEKELRRGSGRASEEMRSTGSGNLSKMKKKESVSETEDKKSLDRISKNFERRSTLKDDSSSRNTAASSELSVRSPLRRSSVSRSSKSHRSSVMSSLLAKLPEKALQEESTLHSLELDKITRNSETYEQKDSTSSAYSEKREEIFSKYTRRSSGLALESRRVSNLEELQSPPSSRISKSSKISYVSMTQMSQEKKAPDTVNSSIRLENNPRISHVSDRPNSKKSLDVSGNLVGQNMLEENVPRLSLLSENIKPENIESSPENNANPDQDGVEQIKVPSVKAENSLTTRRTSENSTESKNNNLKIKKQSLLRNVNEIQEPDVSGNLLSSKNQNSLEEAVATSPASSGVSHIKQLSTSSFSRNSTPKEDEMTRKSEKSDSDKKSLDSSLFSRGSPGSDSQKILQTPGPSTERPGLKSEGQSEAISDLHQLNLGEPVFLTRPNPEGSKTDNTVLVRTASPFQADQFASVKVPSMSENSLNSTKTSDALGRLDQVRNPSSYLTILTNKETDKESESPSAGQPITEIQKFQQEIKDSSGTSEVLRVEDLSDRSAFTADDRNHITATVTNDEQVLGQSDYLRKETRELELPKGKSEETAAESIPELIEFVEQSNEEMRRVFRNGDILERVETTKDKIPQQDVSKIPKPKVPPSTVPSAVPGDDKKPAEDRETKKSPNHIRITIGENLPLSRLRHLLDDFQLDRIIASQPLDQPRRLSRRSKLKLRLVCADSQTPFGDYHKNIPRVANYYNLQGPMRTTYPFSSGDSESESICKCDDSEQEESFGSTQSDWSFPSEEKARTLACAVKKIT